MEPEFRDNDGSLLGVEEKSLVPDSNSVPTYARAKGCQGLLLPAHLPEGAGSLAETQPFNFTR